MKTIHDVAKYCYDKNHSIKSIIPRLTEFELIYLRESVAGGYGNEFFQCARKEIGTHLKLVVKKEKGEQKRLKAEQKAAEKETARLLREEQKVERKRLREIRKAEEREAARIISEQKKYDTFIEIVDSIEHLLCKSHILRDGELSNRLLNRVARRIGIGCMGELPKIWSGFVSLEAIENIENKIHAAFDETDTNAKLTQKTYYGHDSNTEEHFYNMQYAGQVILTWILHFEYDREKFIEMCEVFRQVHITTKDENERLAVNGQNGKDRKVWQDAYKHNNIVLMDGRVKIVDITYLEDVAPRGLLKKVDEVFVIAE